MNIYSGPAIDAHTHLGDIFFPDGGKLIEKVGVKKEKMLFDPISLLEMLSFRKFLKHAVPTSQVVKAVHKRGLAGTRENMRIAMDQANVRYCVALPIPPYVYFKDVNRAARADNGIVPFTGIDYQDMDNLAANLARDVKNGARGMKLHPIVQAMPLNSRQTFEGVEEFAQYGLPILFHSGYFTYPRPEGKKDQAILGSISDAEKLVRAFPKVRFVAGHGGVMASGYTISLLSSYSNVWVDTSTQTTADTARLIEAFGKEKVMYASDWPFTSMEISIKCARKACNGDQGLIRRVLYDNAAQLLELPLS